MTRITPPIALAEQAMTAAPAIIFDDERFDPAWLRARVSRLAGGLAAAGVGRGDRVAIWLPNVPDWLTLHLAAASLGALTVVINTRYRASEVADLLDRTQPALLVYWPGFAGIDFDAILADVPAGSLEAVGGLVAWRPEALKTRAVPDAVPAASEASGGRGSGERPVMAFETLLGAPADALGGADDDPCITFTTSGTTGRPKLALHRQRSIRHHALEVGPAFGYDRDDAVVLQALPLCGTFGHTQAMAALLSGATLVLMPLFDAAAAVRQVRLHRVTHMNGADVMFEDMMTLAGEAGLAPLEGGGFAAFATAEPADLARRAEEAGLRLFGLYGMSEVQALFARQRDDDGAALRARPGGFVVSEGAEVSVRDPETGLDVARGEAGELWLRGPSLFDVYLDDPDATRRARPGDGWLRTGDLARLEPDGSFSFLSRMGDTLRLGGFLVAPAEIEAHVEGLPEVQTCQVVGVDSERGTVPFAFVVASAGESIDPPSVIEHCRRGLARFKVPVRVEVLEAFPTTPSANGEKIQRGRLRDMARVASEGG